MHNAAVHNDLDLLHVHYAIPHATSAWIAREMLDDDSFRFITTLHGTDITLVGQDPSFQAITQFSIAKSDGVTAVSSFLRDETVEHFGLDAGEIEVIPNFVDTTIFEDRKSTRLNSSHVAISYAVFCLKKKKTPRILTRPRQ